MSGYDIRKHVKDVLSAVTDASYGTLYPTLHRLLEDGAVRVEQIEQDNRPAKKLYYLTEQGEAELEEWLKEPPAADKIRREFLLKLYLAKDWSDSELRQLIQERRDDMQAQLENLQSERDQIDDLRRQWIIDYALSIVGAEVAWLKQVEKQIVIA